VQVHCQRGRRALTRSGMTRILALWLSAICFSAYALLVTQLVAWKNSASGSFCHKASTPGRSAAHKHTDIRCVFLQRIP